MLRDVSSTGIVLLRLTNVTTRSFFLIGYITKKVSSKKHHFVNVYSNFFCIVTVSFFISN